MAEVFISYSSHDLERAKALSLALENEGWSVWWDRRILPGERFDKVIRDAIDEADCVIVLWSEASIDSDFVKEEAELGKTRDRLLPVVMDEVPPPLGFGRIQTGSLVGWEGQRDHPGYGSLLVAIANKVTGSRTVAGAASNEAGTSAADTIVVGRESEAGRIGRYETRRILGSGSFATVWLAYDPGLDAEVSVKVLAENWSLDPDIHRRFVEEARILRRLEHPSIIRVYDVGEHTGRPFFVMEYADRGSLLDRMQVRRMSGRPYDVAEAITISERIAESLEVAHAHGVVHRDLKPSNVLFRSSEGWPDRERTMLADFGIARNLQAASGFTISAGTPHYAAPEQAEGQADERSDVHAAAAILYEVLSGTVPYPYPSIGQVLSVQKASGPPSITTIRSDIPADLDDLLLEGLAVDPDQRVASATEWKARLGQIGSGPAGQPAKTTAATAPTAAVISGVPAEAPPDDEAPDDAPPTESDPGLVAEPSPTATGAETIADRVSVTSTDPGSDADLSDSLERDRSEPSATTETLTVVAEPDKPSRRVLLWVGAVAAAVLLGVAGVAVVLNQSGDDPQTMSTTTIPDENETATATPGNTAAAPSEDPEPQGDQAIPLEAHLSGVSVITRDDFSAFGSQDGDSAEWASYGAEPRPTNGTVVAGGNVQETRLFLADAFSIANPAAAYRFRIWSLDPESSRFWLFLEQGAFPETDYRLVGLTNGAETGFAATFEEGSEIQVWEFDRPSPVGLETDVWYETLIAVSPSGEIVVRVWRSDDPATVAEHTVTRPSRWASSDEWWAGFSVIGPEAVLEIDEFILLEFNEIIPMSGIP